MSNRTGAQTFATLVAVVLAAGCPLPPDVAYGRPCSSSAADCESGLVCDSARAICVTPELANNLGDGDGDSDGDAGTIIDDAGEGTDGGGGDPDAGSTDGGPTDAGLVDAGLVDAGPWTFVVNEENFSDGDMGGFEVDGGALRASGASPGASVYTSELFSTEGAVGEAKSLTVVSRTPAGRALPDNTTDDAETMAFSEGGLDLTELKLLLHLDEDEDLEGGSTPDSSGFNRDGVLAGTTIGELEAKRVNGVFDRALRFNGGTYLEVAAVTNADFDYSSASFTWATWVRTSCNGTYVSEVMSESAPEITLGVSCPEATARWRLVADDAEVLEVVGTATVADEDWHHLVGVYDGTTGIATLYVDGVPDGEASAASVLLFTGAFQEALRIGNSGTQSDNGEVSLDEVAVFKRALSSDEVSLLYRRGTFELRFRVKACLAASCGGAAFVGPDGTGATYFGDEGGAESPSVTFTLPAGLAGDRFQLQATMERDDPSFSPTLESMTLFVEGSH